jgi:hypothetical protein
MDFLSKLLQGLAFAPVIVNGIEKVFGNRKGSDKKDAAMAFLQAALSSAEAVASRQIIDDAKFKSGLGMVIDGIVACLNASTWAPKAQPAPVAKP